MTFEEFERHARDVFEEIPEIYRRGIDGLTVRREAPAHPELPGIYTLGECLTETHLSDFGSAETTRSVIALYWGSFRALAQKDPDFDWEGEIWETLTHELRHHLESLAGDDALEGLDYAADEMFKRFEGQDFDPWYYQHGDLVAPGTYRVERSLYVEQEWTDADFERADSITFELEGTTWRIPRPDELGDVHFVLVHGRPEEKDEVEVVLVRRRGWWASVRRMLGASGSLVIESDAEAEPVTGPG